MLSSSSLTVSNRGQWRGSLEIRSPDGSTDPGACVFTFDLLAAGGGCRGGLDYGFQAPLRPAGVPALLSARSNDGTGRLVTQAAPGALILTWLFPVFVMGGICPGAYEASLLAALGAESEELLRFDVVVI